METFVVYIIIGLISTWLLLTIGIVILFHRSMKTMRDSEMSIRESMDLISLPVVTFENNGEKYNFIIDSGANDSIINEECDIVSTPHRQSNDVSGISGETMKCSTVFINFKYKDKTFETLFNVINLSDLFNTIKENYGVTVHGILGTNFLDKYNYVIDFKDYKLYRRK